MFVSDEFAVSEVRVDLGPKQKQLFSKTTTPLEIDATVHYVGSRGHLDAGRANYQLLLWLHHSTNLTHGQLTRLKVHDPLFKGWLRQMRSRVFLCIADNTDSMNDGIN